MKMYLRSVSWFRKDEPDQGKSVSVEGPPMIEVQQLPGNEHKMIVRLHGKTTHSKESVTSQEFEVEFDEADLKLLIQRAKQAVG